MRKNKGYTIIAGAIIFSSIIICFSIITNKPTKPSFDNLAIKVEKTPAEQIIINNNSNYPDGLFGVKIRTDIKDYLHDKDQLLNLIYEASENYYVFGSPKLLACERSGQLLGESVKFLRGILCFFLNLGPLGARGPPGKVRETQLP